MSTGPADIKRGGLPTIAANLAWLLGGKGFGAVCSVVYLAILARSLGLKEFGHFALIFATGQALVAIASFQTWQTIVKFGAPYVRAKEWDKFGRLAGLCGSIDLAGALVGCVIAYLVYYGFGEVLELNEAYVDMAFVFNCAMLFARMTTPNGIVRVLDRFDIGVYVEAIVPAGRLVASVIILFTGGTVAKFLFAWALFDLLSTMVYWIMVIRLLPPGIGQRNCLKPRTALDENDGLLRFFSITFVNATLDALYKQGPLLAVGYFLGTSAAGLYRLAEQLAQGFGKLPQMIGRAVFPELAHAHSEDDPYSFSKLARQIAMISGAGGVVVVVLALLFGEHLIVLIGGEEFSRGAYILVPLLIGAAFELASVSYEPTLYSTGHPRYPMIARLIAVAALTGGILVFVEQGPVAVAWVVAMGLAILYLVLSVITWLVLRDLKRRGS